VPEVRGAEISRGPKIAAPEENFEIVQSLARFPANPTPRADPAAQAPSFGFVL
jgi:hypothetical protein